MNLGSRLGSAILAVSCAIVVAFPIANFVVIAAGHETAANLGVVFWSPALDREFARPGGAYRFDSSWLWEPNPGATIFSDPVNEYACRGPAIPHARNEKARVLVIGDSQSFGHGVRDADSWPRMLESLLSTPSRSVEVVNASCPGHTILLGLSRYLGETSRYSADVVVIAFSVANEAARPPSGRTDAELCIEARRLDSLWSRLSRRLSLLDATAGWMGIERATPRIGRLASFRVAPTEVSFGVSSLIDAIGARGTSIPIVLEPVRLETFQAPGGERSGFDHALLVAAASRSTPVVPTRDALKGSGLGPEGSFRDPLHLTLEGHAVVARAVADAIARSGALTRIK